MVKGIYIYIYIYMYISLAYSFKRETTKFILMAKSYVKIIINNYII